MITSNLKAWYLYTYAILGNDKRYQKKLNCDDERYIAFRGQLAQLKKLATAIWEMEYWLGSIQSMKKVSQLAASIRRLLISFEDLSLDSFVELKPSILNGLKKVISTKGGNNYGN